jgi:hypothetical protein
MSTAGISSCSGARRAKKWFGRGAEFDRAGDDLEEIGPEKTPP